MPTDITDEAMLNLGALRENLNKMMRPEILQEFARLLEATDSPNGSMLDRFKHFHERKTGEKCRYSELAKEFFLRDDAQGCAKAICWLYRNWAKEYE